MRDRVEKKLKIKLEDYSVREQVQFVNFLSSKSISEVEEVKNFLDKGEGDAARKNRVKSFLSLEEGNEKSENIFAIGESLDQKTADAIFAKYAEIVDMTGKFREELDGMFKENREVSQKDLELISQNLIWRANKLLVDFSDKITKNKGDILEQLESYESDLVLTTAFFKSLKQSGAEIKLEDFKGVTFEDKAASEVSDDELKQMLKIYGDNYGNNFEYSADHRNTLVNNLYQKIANGRNDVKIYMYKMKTGKSDTIMVFSAFEDYGEGKRRGTAFNAIEPVAGSPIAKCFLKTILEMETADGMTVVAECDPRSPMSEDYVNRGFNVKGVTDNYPGKGELVLNIEISADNEKYEYKKYSAKDIIDEQGKYVEGDDKMVLNFKIDSAASLDEFMKEVNRMVKQGFVITKYLFGGDKKSVYCGFEKSPS